MVKRQLTGQEETKRTKQSDEEIVDLKVKPAGDQVINLDLDNVTLNEDINNKTISGMS